MKQNRRVLLSLSSKGLIEDPLDMLDKQLAYLFIAEPNQSYLHPEKVSGIADMAAKTHNNLIEGMLDMQSRIQTYFSDKWDHVDCSVSEIKHSPFTEGTGVHIEIALTVMQDGKSYSVRQLYRADNSQFKRITNLYNTGEL